MYSKSAVVIGIPPIQNEEISFSWKKAKNKHTVKTDECQGRTVIVEKTQSVRQQQHNLFGKFMMRVDL